jgi:hypothetical protein
MEISIQEILLVLIKKELEIIKLEEIIKELQKASKEPDVKGE